MQGVSACILSTSLYGKLWEHVVKTVFFNNEIWVQLRRNSELVVALTSANRCSYLRYIPIIDDDVIRMCPIDMTG